MQSGGGKTKGNEHERSEERRSKEFRKRKRV